MLKLWNVKPLNGRYCPPRPHRFIRGDNDNDEGYFRVTKPYWDNNGVSFAPLSEVWMSESLYWLHAYQREISTTFTFQRGCIYTRTYVFKMSYYVNILWWIWIISFQSFHFNHFISMNHFICLLNIFSNHITIFLSYIITNHFEWCLQKEIAQTIVQISEITTSDLLKGISFHLKQSDKIGIEWFWRIIYIVARIVYTRVNTILIFLYCSNNSFIRVGKKSILCYRIIEESYPRSENCVKSFIFLY